MRSFRRLLAAILSLCVFLLSPYTVQADTTENQNNIELQKATEIDALIDEIGALRSQLILREQIENDVTFSLRSDSTVEAEIQKLENELDSLQVEILTDKEVSAIAKSAAVRAVVPDTTNTVRWYSSTYTYTFEGESYIIQRVHAQGRTSGSNLCVIDSQKTLYDCNNVVITEKTDILTVYAQKLAGMVKWLSFLPYELTGGTFTYPSGAVDEVCSATYSIVGTVCFSYVYPESEGETAQMLSHVSTSFNMSATLTVAGVHNARPYAYSPDPINRTVSATDYGSLVAAAKAYVYGSSAPGCSYVNYIQFRGPDNMLGAHVNLPQPEFPIHVH